MLPFYRPGNKGYGEQQYALEQRMGGVRIPPPLYGSRKLIKVILKALSYDPRDRYQTADELREALEKC